jgi:hypothetical protein
VVVLLVLVADRVPALVLAVCDALRAGGDCVEVVELPECDPPQPARRNAVNAASVQTADRRIDHILGRRLRALATPAQPIRGSDTLMPSALLAAYSVMRGISRRADPR